MPEGRQRSSNKPHEPRSDVHAEVTHTQQWVAGTVAVEIKAKLPVISWHTISSSRGRAHLLVACLIGGNQARQLGQGLITILQGVAGGVAMGDLGVKEQDDGCVGIVCVTCAMNDFTSQPSPAKHPSVAANSSCTPHAKALPSTSSSTHTSQLKIPPAIKTEASRHRAPNHPRGAGPLSPSSPWWHAPGRRCTRSPGRGCSQSWDPCRS